ncbi:hypothetical protein ACSSUR_25025 [Pseudomonas cedrina]|uniref:hypothetical protein n=1 Tax=Pseudomonas cedrina TaxID=651740 RepID=UPI003ED9CCFE
MHKNFSSDRKVLEDAIHEMTKIHPPEGQLWVDFSRWLSVAFGQKQKLEGIDENSGDSAFVD